jgi:hypothetical protein
LTSGIGSVGHNEVHDWYQRYVVDQGLTFGPFVTTTPPTIRPHLLSSTLSAAEATQVQIWELALQRIVQKAVQIVDSGQGMTRQSDRFYRSGTPGTPQTRGDAIHFEAFPLIEQSGLNAGRVPTNRGRAERGLGFLNSFGRQRPDIRFALSGGLEAVFDITTVARAGHSLLYRRRSKIT